MLYSIYKYFKCYIIDLAIVTKWGVHYCSKVWGKKDFVIERNIFYSKNALN